MPGARQTQNDRRAIAALFGVFALLIQALIPAAAMATPQDPGFSVICTAFGAQAQGADGKTLPGGAHKGFAGMPCQDCLAAAMAAVIANPATFQPVAYQVARIDHAPLARPPAPRARGPPRPLGQGPPTA